MSGHTKGPWLTADTDPQFVYALNPEGYNRFWFRVSGIHTPTTELEANARLIAAAPLLLRELRHLVRHLKTPINDGRVSVPGIATLNGAEAAIAAATASPASVEPGGER